MAIFRRKSSAPRKAITLGVSRAHLEQYQYKDPNDPLGILPQAPTGPRIDSFVRTKTTIVNAVTTQANELHWHRRLLAALRIYIAKTSIDIRIRLGLIAPLVSDATTALLPACPCTCLLPTGNAGTNTHFEETFSGYVYRFCRYCISKVTFDPLVRRPSDYYFCWTNAPSQFAQNVAEAIRQGELPRSICSRSKRPSFQAVDVGTSDRSATFVLCTACRAQLDTLDAAKEHKCP